MSLFPDDRELPADALDSVQVILSGLDVFIRLGMARQYQLPKMTFPT